MPKDKRDTIEYGLLVRAVTQYDWERNDPKRVSITLVEKRPGDLYPLGPGGSERGSYESDQFRIPAPHAGRYYDGLSLTGWWFGWEEEDRPLDRVRLSLGNWGYSGISTVDLKRAKGQVTVLERIEKALDTTRDARAEATDAYHFAHSILAAIRALKLDFIAFQDGDHNPARYSDARYSFTFEEHGIFVELAAFYREQQVKAFKTKFPHRSAVSA